MSLFGVSPLVFAAGLAGIAAVLGVLHLLRVRLRRVTVDTLLFFRLAGTVQQPRTLLGRPSRWLAFLLALVTAALLWTAFADPVRDTAETSRVLVVDTSGATAGRDADGTPHLTALWAEAVRLAGGGYLGRRGAVITAGADTRVLWRAGEPSGVLAGAPARSWRRGRAASSTAPCSSDGASCTTATRSCCWVARRSHRPTAAASRSCAGRCRQVRRSGSHACSWKRESSGPSPSRRAATPAIGSSCGTATSASQPRRSRRRAAQVAPAASHCRCRQLRRRSSCVWCQATVVPCAPTCRSRWTRGSRSPSRSATACPMRCGSPSKPIRCSPWRPENQRRSRCSSPVHRSPAIAWRSASAAKPARARRVPPSAARSS